MNRSGYCGAWCWLKWVVFLLGVIGFGGCTTSSTTRVVTDAPSTSVSSVGVGDEVDLRRRARLRLELAVGYFEQGQVNVALDEVKQVLNLDSNFAEAYNLRALIYMRLNDPRQAEESFRRALSINSRDADTLHNYGWFLCQSGRTAEGVQALSEVLTSPLYRNQAKTYLSRGLCQARMGDRAQAEIDLAHAYELDAGNPITGYNLAMLLYLRGEYTRAQFYIRRINNSELANAESLWLGVRVERRLSNSSASNQLADQLRRRFPKSKEALALERGAFDD